MSQMHFVFLTAVAVSASLQDPRATSVPLRERSTLRCPVVDLPAISLPIPRGEVSLARSRVVTPLPPLGSIEEEVAKLLRQGATARRLGELARTVGAEAVVDIEVGWTDNTGVRPSPPPPELRIRGVPVKRRSPECQRL